MEIDSTPNSGVEPGDGSTLGDARSWQKMVGADEGAEEVL